MVQNDRSTSPLMRKLQEALERETNTAVLQPPTVPSPINPISIPPVIAAASPREIPAYASAPTFTSAAISQGNYTNSKTDPVLADPVLADPVLAEEDMTQEELAANIRSRRGGLILASTVILAGAAAVAAFIFLLSPQQDIAGPVAEIHAEPTQSRIAPETAPQLRNIVPVEDAQETLLQAPALPTPPISMGDVSNELVAPSTDGLSPARRIGTTRIFLDGDKEIKPQ